MYRFWKDFFLLNPVHRVHGVQVLEGFEHDLRTMPWTATTTASTTGRHADTSEHTLTHQEIYKHVFPLIVSSCARPPQRTTWLHRRCLEALRVLLGVAVELLGQRSVRCARARHKHNLQFCVKCTQWVRNSVYLHKNCRINIGAQEDLLIQDAERTS